MNKFIAKSLLSLIFLCLLSCGEERLHTPPPNLIPKEQMIELLTEIHLIRSASNIRILRDSLDHDLAYSYFMTKLQEMKITEEQFQLSIEYYAEDKDQIHAIYEAVIIGLNRRQQKLKTK